VASAADTASRIEQFRKMAEADPDNELGHFSLGRAYLDAGQYEQAVESLRRVVELNPNISKAYQLLAEAQLKQGKRDSAIQFLTMGARIANERGDHMPRNAMLATLKELGAPVPEFAAKAAPAQPVGEGQVLCSRCGQVKPRMPNAPFSNAQGKMIHERVCADCWREWIGMGTKVINEMRLPLADPQAQKIFDQHMMEFLNLK
jgi:Fe-S cluster biosynthesis and repair protein YggX/predicted TPR repeat methyltransferase